MAGKTYFGGVQQNFPVWRANTTHMKTFNNLVQSAWAWIKSKSWWCCWALLVLIAIPGAWYLFDALPKTDPRDQFLGNFLATIVAALVGIPIALAISRRQQQEEEAKEQADKAIEREEKRKWVLDLILKELVQNRDVLKQIIPIQEKNRFAGVDDDFTNQEWVSESAWLTVSASGELSCVDDLNVLLTITTSYAYIRKLILLDESHLSPSFYQTNYQRGPHLGQRLNYFKRLIPPRALEAIEKALDAMGWKDSDDAAGNLKAAS